jgi:hypothetical protein
VIRPSLRLISHGAEIGKIERNVPALGPGARREPDDLAHTDPIDPFGYREESIDTFPTPDGSNGRCVFNTASAYSSATPPKR